MTDSGKHIVGPTERREEIARIIDPDAFEWPFAEAKRRDHAYAKSDAILASDGGREMVRELVEALEILLAWYHPEDTGTAPLRAVAILAKAKEWLEGKG